MNEDYWRTYYQSAQQQAPSPFAVWAKPRIRGERVWDIGSGDGRDSDYLGAVGVDAYSPNARVQENVETFMTEQPCLSTDTVYARWFLHAVSEGVEDLLLRWTNGQLLAEARVEGDSLDGSHWRRPLNPDRFLQKLEDLNYEVRYFEVGRGFSRVGDDNPLLFRVDAQRA